MHYLHRCSSAILFSLLLFSIPRAFGSEPPPYALEMGKYHSCVIEDNGVTCWGSDNSYGELDVPHGLINVSQVKTELGLSCVIASGELRCWGNAEKIINIPTNFTNVTDVSLATDGGCIVSISGHNCWENPFFTNKIGYFPRLKALNDLAEDIANIDLTDQSLCWQASDQSYQCDIWRTSNSINDTVGISNFELANSAGCVYGDNVLACDHELSDRGLGIINVPEGLTAIQDVAISSSSSACVLHDQGVSCWGENTIQPPENLGNVFDIAASDNAGFCAVTDTGLRCWGYDSGIVSSIPEDLTTPTEVYAAPFSLDNFDRRVCAKHDKGVDCWGENKRSRVTVQQPSKLFSDGSTLCVLDNTGVSCSGYNLPNLMELSSNGITDAAIGSHLCVVKNGQPICIGKDESVQLQPPMDLTNVVDIEAASGAACAIDAEGKLTCWVSNTYYNNLTQIPDGPQLATIIAAGDSHTCALDQEGVKCWGDNNYGQLSVPVGLKNVTELSAEKNWTCATHEAGQTCWGFQQHNPPVTLGNVKSVHSSNQHTCAIDPEGVKCWSINDAFDTAVPGSIVGATKVRVSSIFSCAQSNDKLACWGHEDARISPPQNLSNIQQWGLGDYSGCVLDDSGVQCWGLYGTDVPADLTNVSKLAIGGDRTCALAEGSVTCWGRFSNHATVPPLTPVTDIFSVGSYMCALESHKVSCWNSNGYLDERLTKEMTDITSMAVSAEHICVIKENNVECWDRSSTQAEMTVPVPLGSIKQVAVTSTYACAIGSLANACWGSVPSYVSDFPDNFQQAEKIVLLANSACILDEGDVTCWGLNSQSPMPVGLTGVTQIEAMGSTICALHDEQISCWGFESFASPGSWQGITDFSIIPSASERDICAITSTGVKCRYRTSPHSIDGSDYQFASSSTHSCILQNGSISCNAFQDTHQVEQYSTMTVPVDLGLVSKVYAYDGYITCAKNEQGISCWDKQGEPVRDFEEATELDYDARDRNYCYEKNDRLNCAYFGSGWTGKSLKDLTNTKFLSGKSGKGCFVENGLLECQRGDVPAIDNLTADDQVAVGWGHMCINRSGTLSCYGDNNYGQTDVPIGLGEVTAIAVGTNHSCAAVNDKITCWGKNDGNQLDAPLGLSLVSQLVAGVNFSCALTETGVICWGDKDKNRGDLPKYFITEVPALMNPRQIAASDTHMCALDDIGVKCWGKHEDNSSLQYEQYLVRSPLTTQLMVGSVHACAMANNELSCFDLRNWSKLSLNNESSNVDELFIDGVNLCSVATNGLNCINLLNNNQTFYPQLNNIKDISFNALQACVTTDNEAICFNKEGITYQQSLLNVKTTSNDSHSALCVFGDEIFCSGGYSKPQHNFSNIGTVSSLALGDNNLCYISSGAIGCEYYGGSRPSEKLAFFTDNDNDDTLDYLDTDDDNDGVLDIDDALPLNAFESVDTDLDGIGDNADTDDDNDGVLDVDDIFPLDALEFIDTDGDNIGNHADSDDDGDKYSDIDELISGTDPLNNMSLPIDFDRDFISDLSDTDDDNDGIEDRFDAFINNSTASVDTDLDGKPDSFHLNCDETCVAESGLTLDLDDDNDSYSDVDELANETDTLAADSIPTDNDGDFISDLLDTDDDDDGIEDTIDAFIKNATASVDTDLDAQPDNFHENCDETCVAESGLTLDLDDDNDGYSDVDELANETDTLSADSIPTDNDGDFISDLLDTDDDNDGILDTDDEYPLERNVFSLDVNGDGKVSLPIDGFIILRSMVGFPASALASNDDMFDASRTHDEMAELLDNAKENLALDINGDGKVSLPIDGFIILRHMVGFPASSLASDEDMVEATRTRDEMKSYMVGSQ